MASRAQNQTNSFPKREAKSFLVRHLAKMIQSGKLSKASNILTNFFHQLLSNPQLHLSQSKMKPFFTCILFIYFQWLLTTFAARTNRLPKYLKTCKYQVPDSVINDCIGNAMEDALRTLRNGEPSLGIQPLDPLQVSKLDILQGSGPVSLSVHHRNLTIHGVSKCKIIQSEFNKIDGSLKGTMFCPKIVLDGKYELNGRVLLLPVRGKGKSIIVLDKNKCEFAAHGELVSKNGTLYERYNKINFKITPHKMTMDFENLFGEDKTITKTLNQFINENWREILKEMKPSYEAVFSNVFKDTVERVFSKVPVKNILPDYFENPPASP